MTHKKDTRPLITPREKQELNAAFRADGFLAHHPLEFLDGLQRPCKNLFDIADATNRLAMRCCWRLRPRRSRVHELLGALLFIKAVNSYQAAILLVQRGMSVESQAISRTGLECVIELTALAADPAHSQQMISEHVQHRSIHAKKLIELNDRHGRSLEPSVEAALRKAAEEVGSRGKLEQTAERVGLGAMYQSMYRGTSGNAAHATIGALQRLLDLDADGEIVRVVLGVNMEEIPDALQTAVAMMLECFSPLTILFDIPGAQEESLALAQRLDAVVHPARK